MMFALDCALIILNLGQGEKFNSNQSEVVFRGLTHNSPEVRKKALYVASILLRTPSSGVIVEILQKLKSVVLEEKNSIRFFWKCFPYKKDNDQSYYNTFISLVVMALGARFEDVKLRNTAKSIARDLLRLGGFSEREVKLNKDEKRKIVDFLHDVVKSLVPAPVKWIFYIPFVSEIVRKLVLPVGIFILKMGPNWNPVRFLMRMILRSFLIKTYSQKSFPCNALEMQLFVEEKVGGKVAISNDLASCFESPELENKHEEIILINCRKNNGLIAWYIYTLIPYYVKLAGEQQQRVINLIKTIFNDGGEVSQYIAVSSLWVITKYLSNVLSNEMLEEVKRLYNDYCKKFLSKYSWWITFRYDVDTSSSKSKVIKKYYNSINGYIKKHKVYGCEVDWYEHSIRMMYENGIFIKYCEFLGRERYEDFDVVYNIIVESIAKSKKIDDILLYSISRLGDVGEQFPDEAFNILKKLSIDIESENLINNNEVDINEIKSKVASSLAKIARIHPISIFSKLDEFPSNWRKVLDTLITKELKGVYAEISYAGESLYQNFLLRNKARVAFAKGIKESGNAKNLKSFFSSFTKTTFDLIIDDPKIMEDDPDENSMITEPVVCNRGLAD